jgi:hypothetical protein
LNRRIEFQLNLHFIPLAGGTIGRGAFLCIEHLPLTCIPDATILHEHHPDNASIPAPRRTAITRTRNRTFMIPRSIILCLCLMLLACSGGSPGISGPDGTRLTLLSSHSLGIGEPSGLALDASRSSLWTVGNDPQRIYRLSLDGRIQSILDYEGDDIEGIASDPLDGTLWIVEEDRREVVHLSSSGRVLERHQLDLDGKANSGLEGICLDSDGVVYVLNEKNPGLFISLNADLSIKKQHQLDFAKDFSGLSCDSSRNAFWVLSDQSRTLFLWSPEEGVLGGYALPFAKAEGVAVDAVEDIVYIASESESMLYVYRIE